MNVCTYEYMYVKYVKCVMIVEHRAHQKKVVFQRWMFVMAKVVARQIGVKQNVLIAFTFY